MANRMAKVTMRHYWQLVEVIMDTPPFKSMSEERRDICNHHLQVIAIDLSYGPWCDKLAHAMTFLGHVAATRGTVLDRIHL